MNLLIALLLAGMLLGFLGLVGWVAWEATAGRRRVGPGQEDAGTGPWRPPGLAADHPPGSQGGGRADEGQEGGEDPAPEGRPVADDEL